MDYSTGKAIGALAVMLIAWVARRIYLRPRLFGLVQQLYEHSIPFVASNTVSLAVINSGRLLEEDVIVKIAPGFDCHLVAATESGVELSGAGELRIGRLHPKQRVSLLFRAEGGERFRREHIRSVTSKTSQGKITENAADAEASTPVVLAGTLVLFAVLGGGGFFLGYHWPKEDAVSAAFDAEGPAISVAFSKGCVDAQSLLIPREASETLDTAAVAAAVFDVTAVERRGDYVLVTVHLTNPLSRSMEASAVDIKSPADEDLRILPSGVKRAVYGILLIREGSQRSVRLAAYLPESAPDQILKLGVSVSFDGGARFWFSQNLILGEARELQCASND